MFVICNFFLPLSLMIKFAVVYVVCYKGWIFAILPSYVQVSFICT